MYSERTFGQLLTMFVGGLRFDTTAILYTNVLYITMFLLPFRFRYNLTYQSIAKYIYFITNGIALLMNCMDTVYFRNTFRRTTLNIFNEFSNNEKLGAIFTDAIIQNWYLTLFFIISIVLLVWSYGKYTNKQYIPKFNLLKYYALAVLTMFIGIAAAIIGVRGGISSDRPLNINHSAGYATAAIDIPLIINTPFSVIKSVDRKTITPLIYFDNHDEMNEIYSPVRNTVKKECGFKEMNIVLIILESFSREYFGYYNPDLDNGTYKGYTPFLDTLLGKHSFAPLYSYGNGRKSIDAVVSTLLSLPAIPEPFVLSSYFNNEVRSLPLLLLEKGYETAFFCGHPKGTMGYFQLCKIIGINHYFGMEEYGNNSDYDGVWGIWDDEFLQFTASKINELRQPFLSTIYTITSHSPFKLPKHRDDDFGPEQKPIYRSIRYVDEALQHFFETVATQPWFNNTLFVLVADHVNIITYDEYRTSSELFAVPVAFYKPDGSLQKNERTVIQHIDVMPTILGYLNYDEPYVAFGFDLNETNDNFVFNYFNGTYQLITDQYLLLFDGQKSTGLYELRNDKFLQTNLINTNTEIVNELELKAKAFLQEYTTRMVENRLTVKHKT